jgi:hypothetical protein
MNHPMIEAAKIDAQRNVALARLRAFEDECFLLGELACRYDCKPDISDFLYRVAEANGLAVAHGDGLIHMIMVAGLRGGE